MIRRNGGIFKGFWIRYAVPAWVGSAPMTRRPLKSSRRSWTGWNLSLIHIWIYLGKQGFHQGEIGELKLSGFLDFSPEIAVRQLCQMCIRDRSLAGAAPKPFQQKVAALKQESIAHPSEETDQNSTCLLYTSRRPVSCLLP